MPSKVRHSFNIPGRVELGSRRDVNYIRMTPDNQGIEMIVKGGPVAKFMNENAGTDLPAGFSTMSLQLPDSTETSKIAAMHSTQLPAFDAEEDDQRGLLIDMQSFDENYRLFMAESAQTDTVFNHPLMSSSEENIKQSGWVFKKEISDDFSNQMYLKFGFDDKILGQGRVSTVAAHIGGLVGFSHCHNTDTIVPVTMYTDVMSGINCTPEHCWALVQAIDVQEFYIEQDGLPEFTEGDDTELGTFFGFNADDFAAAPGNDPALVVANKCVVRYENGTQTLTRNALCYDKLIPILWNALKSIELGSGPAGSIEQLLVSNSSGSATTDQVAVLETQHTTSTHPVLVIEPIEEKVMGVAIAPQASTDFGTDGLSWLDIADAPLINNSSDPVSTLRLANQEDRIEIGTRTFNGGSAKDIVYTRSNGAFPAMAVRTSGQVVVGDAAPNSTTNVVNNAKLIISNSNPTLVYEARTTSDTDIDKQVLQMSYTSGGVYRHVHFNNNNQVIWTPYGTWMDSSEDGGTTTICDDNQGFPDNQTVLWVKSSLRPMRIPEISDAAKGNISPARGMILYSKTNDRLEYYNGSMWVGV